MSDYTAFFLDASAGIVLLECVEISHPSFSQVFRYVKNDIDGITAEGNFFDYQAMSIKRSNVSNDLEQKMSLTIADMQDELSNAIRGIRTSDYANVRPSFKFKIFRDDDLSNAMVTLQTLEIATVSKDSDGLVTFDAKAPSLNDVGTGVVYSIEDFPLLRGI